MDDKNATQQVNIKAGRGGTIPPVSRRFGQPGANPRNNGGVPKYVREIRAELKNLLDPNLTMEDYKAIADSASTESGLRAVFAEAVIKQDTRTVIQLIDQAYGKPKESVDLTTDGESLKQDELTAEFRGEFINFLKSK